MFVTDYKQIELQLANINPVSYCRNRNFIDGDVTRLSPYISRGVISTKDVLNSLIERDYSLAKIQKFIQELLWRDYWQQVWVEKGKFINDDLKHPQSNVLNRSIPIAVLQAKTGVKAIDYAIKDFYKTGYLHNHVRMYIASLCCNVAKSHWKAPAQWMYYHLLDADWASNALSWQWVCGSNSHKKYYANQENINKYCRTEQKGSFLDVEYDAFLYMDVPRKLQELDSPNLSQWFPVADVIKLDDTQPTYVYNFYNLDPKWDSNIKANRVLLLEPSHFSDYPVSEKVMQFVIDLSKNIEGIQIVVGEFDEVFKEIGDENIFFKEHPLFSHYNGNEIEREWMTSVKGYYPSFFKFWNKAKKEFS